MGTAFDVNSEVARLIQQKLVELPTYPGVALKLQKLLSGGEYDFEALTKLVQADQALTVQVMRAANSAFYRATTPITTLTAAIGRIGAKELANIAIAGTLGLTANAAGPLASLRKDAWRLALTTGVIAQELAPSEQVNPGEAFLAGLLHDFGMTIAYACFELVIEMHPDVAPRTLEQWQEEAMRFHIELGLALAADWKLPAFVSEAVTNEREDASGLAHPALVKLVGKSARIGRRILAAPSIDAAQVRQVSGLSERALEKLDGLFPRVPSYLQSFEEAAPESAPTPAPAPVAKPPAPRSSLSGMRPAAAWPMKSTPTPPPVAPKVSPVAPSPPPPPRADVRELSLQVAVVKKGARISYRAIEVARESLKLIGATAQGERQLLNLEVQKLQLCATVQSCVPCPEGFMLELKPFAMDRPTANQFEQLGKAKAA
ncbi:MAG: HDOD domain-containing protein [Archangium sp.]